MVIIVAEELRQIRNARKYIHRVIAPSSVLPHPSFLRVMHTVTKSLAKKK